MEESSNSGKGRKKGKNLSMSMSMSMQCGGEKEGNPHLETFLPIEVICISNSDEISAKESDDN